MSKMPIRLFFIALLLVIAALALVLAATGDLLGIVTLPGNGGCSVAGTFDGIYYMTINTGGCVGTVIGIYSPPLGGNGTATLVSTKNIVDGANNSVSISALAWDPSRNKLWGAYNDQVFLIDVGDKTMNTDAVATLEFNAGVGGIPLIDGLAYDGSDDTIYYSPDVDCNVHHFSPNGTLLNTVTPKDVNGVADCFVSGVVVGSGNTLYIGRNGFAEIRRVDKTTGDFVSNFATTAGRVEDLTCDPVTYAPKEAILAKDAHNGLYEAFEVEEGTCPLQGGDTNPPKVSCIETVNPHGKKIPPAGSTTLPGPKGGQNEDGFYKLLAEDDSGLSVQIFVTDSFGSGPFGPFLSGHKIKITEAPGAIPSSKPIGSSNGQAGAIVAHITLKSDAIITATDSAGNSASISCLVPPPPK